MRGADAYFLRQESRAHHMHTLKIVVVDPSAAHATIDFERVRTGALHVLPHLPAFRLRPVNPVLGMGHHVWVEAPVLDPDYHFRHEVLPPDSEECALDELLSRIASEPLDPERPLWQIVFVEGLPGGHIAYVTKIHHAVADGNASAELVLRFFDEDPTGSEIPAAYEGTNEPIPSAMQRLVAMLRREIVRQRHLPNVVWRSLVDLGAGLRSRLGGGPQPPRPFRSPETRFNLPLTPNRVVTHVTLPLPEMRRCKRVLGGTLNDVYLALVGGALRTYLEQHGELEPEPLSAAVPVAVRGPDDDPVFGNATAYWFATTGSDVADPAERLRTVAESTRAARALFEARDPRLPVDWLDFWILRRVYLNGLALAGRALARRPTFNVIVSNVRGPADPIFNDGAAVEELYSMGPLAHQQGLNFTAWSYGDRFTVGIHACREHVPDVRVLADALPIELEKLAKSASSAADREAAPPVA